MKSPERRNYIFTLLLILSNGVAGLCQEYIQVRGRVFDALDSTELPNVAIHLSNRFVGTFSNTVGYFELNIESKYKSDTIVVSHIGYESHRFLSIAATSDTLEIFIKPKPFLLREVEIRGENDSLRSIVAEALKRISVNYPVKQHFLTGFYRQIQRQKGEFVRLIEAAVDIHDFGYASDIQKTRIQVQQLRKSDFFGNDNPLKRTFRFFLGDRNQLYDVYEENWIRSFLVNDQPSEYIYNSNFPNIHNFKLEGVTSAEDDTTLVISYRIKKKVDAEIGDGILFEPHGRLFISQKNLAIIKLEEFVGTLQKLDSPVSRKYTYDGANMGKRTFLFRKLHNRYYLNSIEQIKFLGADDYEFRSLLINNVIEDKSELKRIKKRFQN